MSNPTPERIAEIRAVDAENGPGEQDSADNAIRDLLAYIDEREEQLEYLQGRLETQTALLPEEVADFRDWQDSEKLWKQVDAKTPEQIKADLFKAGYTEESLVESRKKLALSISKELGSHISALEAKCRLAEAERMKDDKAMDQLIDERDKAEEFGSHLYYLITGRSPEWSNLFGYDQATEDVDDAQRVLRESLKQAESALTALREAKPVTKGEGKT